MRLFRAKKYSEKEENQQTEEETKTQSSTAGNALINKLISAEGYTFGEPWKLTDESLSAAVPILKTIVQNRKCLVIQEIPKDRINISDSGKIDRLNVELRGINEPVFVRAGTIFKGKGTQSRTSGLGVILGPGKSGSVDVFCVHASRRISPTLRFSTLRDVAPRRVEDVLTSPMKTQRDVWRATAVRPLRSRATNCPSCGSARLFQNYESELVCVACGNAINPTPRADSVRRITRLISRGESSRHAYRFSSRVCSSPMALSDSLVANLDAMARFNREVEKTLSKVPADLENQVGIVIIDSRGVLGLETFDHPDSWRAFSRSIVRNYADVLAKERAKEGLFILKTERIPKAIKKFMEKAKNLSETSVFKNQTGETKMLSGELAGEYTTLGDDVIHLLLKRKISCQA